MSEDVRQANDYRDASDSKPLMACCILLENCECDMTNYFFKREASHTDNPLCPSVRYNCFF